MEHDDTLRALLGADAKRMALLTSVQSLALPDCWIGAGFVRDAVWEALHGRPPAHQSGDVDVIWFDPNKADPIEDRRLEVRLAALDGSVRWSVKNQARMHRRNGDAAYTSAAHAIWHWPETATAVAVRWTEGGTCEVIAPFGLGDLFNLVVRPTPHFTHEKRGIVLERIRAKAWLKKWPNLRLEL